MSRRLRPKFLLLLLIPVALAGWLTGSAESVSGKTSQWNARAASADSPLRTAFHLPAELPQRIQKRPRRLIPPPLPRR